MVHSGGSARQLDEAGVASAMGCDEWAAWCCCSVRKVGQVGNNAWGVGGMLTVVLVGERLIWDAGERSSWARGVRSLISAGQWATGDRLGGGCLVSAVDWRQTGLDYLDWRLITGRQLT